MNDHEQASAAEKAREKAQLRRARERFLNLLAAATGEWFENEVKKGRSRAEVLVELLRMEPLEEDEKDR